MAEKETRDFFGAYLHVGDRVIVPDDMATKPFIVGVIDKICSKTVKVVYNTNNKYGEVYKRPEDQVIKVSTTMEWLMDE